jgi:carboxymethylenebutenolidase
MRYNSLIAENIALSVGGDEVEAYYARPQGPGPFPGMIVTHYAASLDDWNRELCRTFAYHGYAAIAPNFYSRFGTGTPEEQGIAAREAGGVADDSVVADTDAALRFLRGQPNASGKVGAIGCCAGGRLAFLVAARLPFNALVDCFGGSVIAQGPQDITEKRPKAPIDYVDGLKDVPVIGLFGNDDQNPGREQVNQTEEIFKQKGIQYEFHRYDDAGHGFNVDIRPVFKPVQSLDAWTKIFEFCDRVLR